MNMRLLVTSALGSTLIYAPVMAQEATSADEGISEIVVTAQRKTESSQKAAIALDAVSSDKLISAGVTGSGGLNKVVPSLQVVNGGGSNTSIYLRGVGNRVNSSYVDPAVAISYDGVFFGRSAGAFGSSFFDLQRVEVLKGPQGILYGRNATGGAINMIPQRPQLGQFHAGFSGSAGNYDAFSVDGFVNAPIGDNAALRVAGSAMSHKGYNNDGSSDLDSKALRAQLLFEPTDTLSIRVGADWTFQGGVGSGFTYLGNFTPDGSGGYTYTPSTLSTSEGLNTAAANAYRETILGAPGFGFFTAMNEQQKNHYTYWGVNSEIKLQTGLGELTFIPAFRKNTGYSNFYGPAFNTAIARETDTQTSFELRLSGKTGAFDYLVGAYNFNEKIDNNGEYNQEFVLPIQKYVQNTHSLAAFAQLTFHATDKLRLVAGGRYTRDVKDMDGLINNFITFCGGPGPALITPPASFAQGCANPDGLPRYPNFLNVADTVNWLKTNGWIAADTVVTDTTQVFPLLNGVGTILKTHFPVVDKGTFSRPTWKLSAEYDVAPASLLYATAESGYRAGGFQLAEGRPRYKPEFITAFSIGSKNRFLNNKVQLNVEAFLWKYKDQQISYFTLDNSGTLINSTENAGRVTIKGVDIDAIVKPAAMTTLSAKIQYLDAKYDDLHLYTAAPRDVFNCPFTVTGSLSDGTPIKDFNCSGKPAQYSPKWTINLTAEQGYAINADATLYARLSTSYRTEQFGAFEFQDFELIRPYWETDAEVRLELSRYAISAFVRNLENKRRVAAPTLAPTNQAVAIMTPPRTYGIRISGEF